MPINETFGTSAITLKKLSAVGTGYNEGDSFWSTWGDGAITTPLLQASFVESYGTYGIGDITLPLLRATGGSYSTYGSGVIEIPKLIASGYSHSTLGSGVIILPMLRASGYSQHTYGSGRINLKLLNAVGAGYSGTIGSGVITLPLLAVSISEYEVTFGNGVITLPLLRVSGLAKSDYLCLVLNTDVMALTKYTNFDFDRIVEFQGHLLTLSSTGIFEITGKKDNGVNISAVVKSGLNDMGTPYMKREIEYLIGMKSNGDMKITGILDDALSASSITVDTTDDIPKTRRAVIGKGDRGRYIGVMIENIDGADFSIDTVHIMANKTSRSH